MKTCNCCGSVFEKNEKFCSRCGTRLENEPNGTLCTLSLVFGILGWLMLVPVLSPLAALLTGRAALKEGKSGAASAGIVLGVTALSFTALGVLLALLALIFNAI